MIYYFCPHTSSFSLLPHRGRKKIYIHLMETYIKFRSIYIRKRPMLIHGKRTGGPPLPYDLDSTGGRWAWVLGGFGPMQQLGP
jgi:hypothetical protein